MAGFPSHAPAESNECPECRAFPECPVSPVSEGQGVDGEMDKRLKALAAQIACTQPNTARTRRFKLLRRNRLSRPLRARVRVEWDGTGALGKNGFQRKARIEVLCSQPFVIIKGRLVLVP